MRMTCRARKSHVGSCLSCADILAVLFANLNLTPKLGPDEDRICVGKGWIASIFFWLLAQRKIIPKSDLRRFCAPGEREYIGLLEPSVRGVSMAGGSVGYGLPFAVGMALAKKLTGRKGLVVAIEGDGAMQSGTTWEAAQLATSLGLDNLILIVDRNGLQAMGEVERINPNGNLAAKFEAFGWQAESVDGHDHGRLAEAVSGRRIRPMAVIADTVKGRGVGFMEDDFTWHYRAPDVRQMNAAIKEIYAR